MSLRLILEDSAGQVTRQIPVKGTSAHLIQRHDTKRLEVVSDISPLEEGRVQFSKIADLNFEELKSTALQLGSFGSMRLANDIATVPMDGVLKEHNRRDLQASIMAVAGLCLLVTSIVTFAPRESAKVTEELKQQIVKIVKTREVVKTKMTMNPSTNSTVQDPTATKVQNKKAEAVKRAGALSVLGSLKGGKNRGGLNLGAANATAGPGLGGTAGSGGVQTSLYGKGITSAALGPGANINGGGGYGTKGKGGGQAGYGSLSLVGSAGGSPVQLGGEAEVATGLDKAQIDEVIRRNLGQVRFCYEQALQNNASLNGRIAMGFTIGADGLVKSANVESSSMASKGVEDCITLRLKTWKFPLPQGGVDVKVSYPFVLRRQGQG